MYGWGKHKITCKAAQFRASGRDLGKIIKNFKKTIDIHAK